MSICPYTKPLLREREHAVLNPSHNIGGRVGSQRWPLHALLFKLSGDIYSSAIDPEFMASLSLKAVVLPTMPDLTQAVDALQRLNDFYSVSLDWMDRGDYSPDNSGKTSWAMCSSL